MNFCGELKKYETFAPTKQKIDYLEKVSTQGMTYQFLTLFFTLWLSFYLILKSVVKNHKNAKILYFSIIEKGVEKSLAAYQLVDICKYDNFISFQKPDNKI